MKNSLTTGSATEDDIPFQQWTNVDIIVTACVMLSFKYSETWITRTAGDHQKSLSYEKFEL